MRTIRTPLNKFRDREYTLTVRMLKKYSLFKLRNIVNKRVYTHSKIKTWHVAVTKVGETKQSWRKAFISLWEPTLNKFSKGNARVQITGPQISANGKKSDGYESFARTFIGVAFYLHQKQESIVRLSNGEKIDIAEIYRKGIVNGTNPKHHEYWGKIKSKQRLVENASIALGLLLTRQHILCRFSKEERHNLTKWFSTNVVKDFPMNNWQWFKVFHYLLLEEIECGIDENDMKETLIRLEHPYQGNGWYSDGMSTLECHYDYYVPWAMHFYSLLFAYLAGNKYGKWKKRYIARAKKFMSDYQYFFTPGNPPPLYGRSQTYRFASLAPWGVSLLLNCCDVDYSWLKRSAVDTVNTFLERGATRSDGILTMGYYNEFTPILEKYNGPGSPYWAFKGFSLLLLPEKHPFWKVKTEKVEPKKVVYSIPITKLMLTHDGNSQIVMLNAGSSNAGRAIKYNKFAYSNIFLPNFGGNPVDNALLLKSEKDFLWRQRGRIIENSCNGNVCELKWIPNKIDQTIVKTILIGRHDGYVIFHRIYNMYPLLFQSGGFAIAQDNKEIQKQVKENESVLSGRQGEVGVKLLFGQAKAFIYENSDVNL